MKPSKMFHDDNSSSKYWSENNIVRWSKECMSRSTSVMSLKLLAKIVILSFLLVGFGFLLLSWIHPYSSPTTRPSTDQELMIITINANLSINNSALTEDSSKINNQQKTSTLPSTNVISHDGPVEKSIDDVLLTKKYVSRFNSSIIAYLFSTPT